MQSTLDRLRRDEQGSAVVDFVLVSVLLTALVLAVMQLAFALYVRNTVRDAAAEGARYAALADRNPSDGALRTAELIALALGPSYARDVLGGYSEVNGIASVEVTVRTGLPLVGPLALPDALEVSGHAAVEPLE